MIYSFKTDIFSKNDDSTLDMLNKIWIDCKERHFLYINSSLFRTIKDSQWYSGLRKSNKEFLDLIYADSANIKERDVSIYISNENSDCFTLIEAIEILIKPLVIILENIEYDLFFLNALLRCFKTESETITSHIDNGWIDIQNGGGANIVNVINVKKRRFENGKKDFPKESKIYLRTFIIIDSDKKFPHEAEVDENKENLLKFIKDNSAYHVTTKREMENYLPSITLKEIQGNDEFIDSLLMLNDMQRDYIDIEKGLPDKNIEGFEPEQLRQLYEDLSDPKKTKMLSNLRKKQLVFTKANGKKANFKSCFPIYFNKNSVTRDTLKERAGSNELEVILKKINELI